MTALIIVDLQNDFLPGGALAVPESDQIIPVINELQKYVDLVVATQDWHPTDHESFANNHPEHKEGDLITLHGLSQILWPVHCVQDTFGAQLSSKLKTSCILKVFQKGTDKEIDSYSGFYDNGYRKSTGLSEFLKERNIDQVVVVGLATDFCVKYTALDALKEGFKTTIVKEATRAVNLNVQDYEKAIAEIEQKGGIVLNLKSFVQEYKKLK
ncbi:bifunctional nicotinamidase/pyrazinamidase [Xanthovirga aplysinae]|uniref:bifunctional nicotinamidase/pyrazinamidase n=1 Tax=Xanthovirga aplysinae TaxID=2529853 RepID=UPI0012BD2DAC|nr:bifunctional nicotinamidase/pyrazinamidase [Xanthovirga aplysinae]MTI30336.1 bifunctional nicotinamidase/pyrazinamidase [Xanthovirga aplysinae]